MTQFRADLPGFWTDEDRAFLGKKLRGLRQAQDLKQADVAKKTDMSIGTVQGIEYNKHKVSAARFDQYARLLGTTIEQLRRPEAPANSSPANGSGYSLPPPTDVRWRIVERLQRLNEDDVRILDAMSEHLDRRR